MPKNTPQKPDYSNWVSSRFIYIPWVISLLFLGLSLVLPVLIIIGILFFVVSIYFSYAYYRFSPRGGNIQRQIQELLLSHLDWNGEGMALDIGCGNAPLTIMLSQTYPNARVAGIDYWGEMWDYSKRVCESNAQIEGVADRVTFQKASASKLPFEDGAFDAAVSNLVFHEVSDTKDKRELIREALRVVKKGGKFAFQDLFLEPKTFGETGELLALIRSWGVTRVEFERTCDAPFIPWALKLPFMVGTLGVLYGEK
jgi:ubiquinone/menaquinone biosynthesis C-methylase UbiE